MPKIFKKSQGLPAYISGLIVVALVMLFGALNLEERQEQANQDGHLYQAIRIIDGDTAELEDIGRVRLIGIDTPETRAPGTPVECFGKEATHHLSKLIENKKVRIEQDPSQQEVDRYGRILVYIFIGAENINQKMISDGYAYEYTYNTPYKYQAQFKAAQVIARDQSRGLWSEDTCNGQR